MVSIYKIWNYGLDHYDSFLKEHGKYDIDDSSKRIYIANFLYSDVNTEEESLKKDKLYEFISEVVLDSMGLKYPNEEFLNRVIKIVNSVDDENKVILLPQDIPKFLRNSELYGSFDESDNEEFNIDLDLIVLNDKVDNIEDYIKLLNTCMFWGIEIPKSLEEYGFKDKKNVLEYLYPNSSSVIVRELIQDLTQKPNEILDYLEENENLKQMIKICIELEKYIFSSEFKKEEIIDKIFKLMKTEFGDTISYLDENSINLLRIDSSNIFFINTEFNNFHNHNIGILLDMINNPDNNDYLLTKYKFFLSSISFIHKNNADSNIIAIKINSCKDDRLFKYYYDEIYKLKNTFDNNFMVANVN